MKKILFLILILAISSISVFAVERDGIDLNFIVSDLGDKIEFQMQFTNIEEEPLENAYVLLEFNQQPFQIQDGLNPSNWALNGIEYIGSNSYQKDGRYITAYFTQSLAGYANYVSPKVVMEKKEGLELKTYLIKNHSKNIPAIEEVDVWEMATSERQLESYKGFTEKEQKEKAIKKIQNEENKDENTETPQDKVTIKRVLTLEEREALSTPIKDNKGQTHSSNKESKTTSLNGRNIKETKDGILYIEEEKNIEDVTEKELEDTAFINETIENETSGNIDSSKDTKESTLSTSDKVELGDKTKIKNDGMIKQENILLFGGLAILILGVLGLIVYSFKNKSV